MDESAEIKKDVKMTAFNRICLNFELDKIQMSCIVGFMIWEANLKSVESKVSSIQFNLLTKSLYPIFLV